MLVADFYTKPLQGPLFRKFRNFILNLQDEYSGYHSKMQPDATTKATKAKLLSQECVKKVYLIVGLKSHTQNQRIVT